MADDDKKILTPDQKKKRADIHRNYMKKHDQVEVKVFMKSDKRSKVQKFARDRGMNTSEFINKAIDEKMDRESD